MISARIFILVLVVFLMVGLMSGCSFLRPPVPECRIPEPPSELLRIPQPLPPIPRDLPRAST